MRAARRRRAGAERNKEDGRQRRGGKPAPKEEILPDSRGKKGGKA